MDDEDSRSLTCTFPPVDRHNHSAIDSTQHRVLAGIGTRHSAVRRHRQGSIAR